MNRVHHPRGESSTASSANFSKDIVELSHSFDASLQPVHNSSGSSTRRDETSPSENYYKQCLRTGFKDIRHQHYQSSGSDGGGRISPHLNQHQRYQQTSTNTSVGRKPRELYRSNSSLELDSGEPQLRNGSRGVGVGAEFIDDDDDDERRRHHHQQHHRHQQHAHHRRLHHQTKGGVVHASYHERNAAKHRDYGSANSLDTLNPDSFFSTLDQCQDAPSSMSTLPTSALAAKVPLACTPTVNCNSRTFVIVILISDRMRFQ